jgi:hypothetical protein
MRRARPLGEFVPAAPEVVHQMIIGWFISILLGQRETTGDKIKGPKVSVWDAEERKYYAFAHPLLPITSREVENNLELLPTILKSLVLTFAECNNSSSLEPMRAYWRLMDLGSDYQSILTAWIKRAELEIDAPTPETKMAGSKDGDFESRKEILLKILNRTKATYGDAYEKDSKINNPYKLSKVFELKEQISKALDEIFSFIDGMTEETAAI